MLHDEFKMNIHGSARNKPFLAKSNECNLSITV